MSYWKENELTPRRRPPVGHGPQSIPRIQPEVPEVSVFFTNRSEVEEIQPRRLPRFEEPVLKKSLDFDSSSLNLPKQLSENPREPLANLNWPQNDLNGMKFGSSVKSTKEKSTGGLKKTISSAPNVLETNKEVKESIKIPEELLKIVSWQNDQIVRLENQLKELQDRNTDLQVKLNESLMRNESQSNSANKSRNASDGSTQTFEVTSPNRSREEHSIQACSPLDSLRHQTDISRSVLREEMSGFYQEEEEDSDDNEKEDEEEECDEILVELDHTRNQLRQKEDSFHSQDQDNLDRWRQMGISFIKPEELMPSGGQSESRFESFYPLHIPKVIPDSLTTESTISKSNLAMNSAALKYLDDRKLTEMARGNEAKTDSVVSQFGLSENHLSVATRNFLRDNNLAPNPREMPSKRNSRLSDEGTIQELTERLRFPKM